MKKELSKPAIAGIGAGAVLLVGGGLWFAFGKMMDDGGPSPELRDKQIAYQKSLLPGGGKGGAVAPNAGFQSEMAARSKTPGK